LLSPWKILFFYFRPHKFVLKVNKSQHKKLSYLSGNSSILLGKKVLKSKNSQKIVTQVISILKTKNI